MALSRCPPYWRRELIFLRWHGSAWSSIDDTRRLLWPMQTAGITVEASPALSMDEVDALYRAVGWTTYTDDVVTLEAALVGSSHVVVARRDDL